MLYEVDEERVYCGPAALIAVSGKRLPEVREAINNVRGRALNAGVCGLSVKHLLEAATILGIRHYAQVCEFPEHVKTLKKMVADPSWCLPGRTYIIGVTGHYVAVCDGVVIDNHTRFGSPVYEHWCANKKVKELIWVRDDK